jgi:hypothetical protein
MANERKQRRPLQKSSKNARSTSTVKSREVMTSGATRSTPGGPQRRSTYFDAVALYERGLEALQRHDYRQATTSGRIKAPVEH